VVEVYALQSALYLSTSSPQREINPRQRLSESLTPSPSSHGFKNIIRTKVHSIYCQRPNKIEFCFYLSCSSHVRCCELPCLVYDKWLSLCSTYNTRPTMWHGSSVCTEQTTRCTD